MYKKEIVTVSTAMRIGFPEIAYDWQSKHLRSIFRSAIHDDVVVYLLVQATG